MNPRRLALTLLYCVISVGCDSNVADKPTSTPATKSQSITTTTPSAPATKSQSSTTTTPSPPASEINQPNYEVAEVYADLRKQALRLKPESIGLNDADQSAVIAVLMETGYPEAVATLVAVVDGTASLYFSNGGGIIGGGEHESVRKVAKEFVSFSQKYVSQAALTKVFPLPQKDNVRVYMVTGDGVYTFNASENDLGDNRHPCSPVFHKGHELITAIREHTPE